MQTYVNNVFMSDSFSLSGIQSAESHHLERTHLYRLARVLATVC